MPDNIPQLLSPSRISEGERLDLPSVPEFTITAAMNSIIMSEFRIPSNTSIQFEMLLRTIERTHLLDVIHVIIES